MAAFDASLGLSDLEGAHAYAGATAVSDALARAAFGRAVFSVLSHRGDVLEHVEQALHHEPDFAAARILRGFALRLLGRRDQLEPIGSELQKAERALLRYDGARERQLFAALTAFIPGDAQRAADHLEALATEAGGDALAMKLAHACRFLVGDAAGLLRGAHDAHEALQRASHPARGFARGCLAFAYEENRDYARALSIGRSAVEIEPLDVWGIHAVAHVHYELGNHEQGLHWLQQEAKIPSDVGNLAGHVAWHEALFAYELLDFDAVQRLLIERINIYPPRDYRDFANVMTLTLKLDARGFDTEARFDQLADLAYCHLGDHLSAFADLHYLLALLFAGRLAEARSFTKSLERQVQSQDPVEVAVQRDLGLPLFKALQCAFEDSIEAAEPKLKALGPKLMLLGGSHAQRRVIPWALTALRARKTRRLARGFKG